MTSVLDPYQAFAVDLDGVVWRGANFIEGATDALKELISRGRPVLLLTNNAAYPGAEVSARLSPAGVDIAPEMVLNTAMVARRWLESNRMKGKRAIVLAAPSVSAQLSDCIEPVPATRGQGAELVIVGRDVSFDFWKLDAAAAAVSEGALLLAMNRDTSMPVDEQIQPGTGAILAAIEAASGRQAVILGKPELPMMQAAAQILGKRKTLMIGDRIDSDIVGAHRIGWDAALVLSGVDQTPEEGERPELVARSLKDLVEMVQET